MNQLAHVQQPVYTLTVLSGVEKGVIYQLVAGRVTIGRGSENNIIIKDDPKISRNHAVIKVTASSVEISDVSDRNKILVGDEEVTSRALQPGDLFQLGNTKFQFKTLAQKAELDIFSTSNLGGGIAATPKSSNKTKRQSQNAQSKMNFYIIVGVVAILFAWLLNSNVTNKAPAKLRTADDAQLDIDANKKIVESINSDREKSGENSRQYNEAQTNFIKGFRDYRKGQYDRAIESFQACLSLFTTHPQCQRYLRLAEKKYHELIQYHMVLANKYRAQNQFAACRSSYRNAMVMIKNPADKIYIEAKSGYDACKALEGDRF